MMKHDVVEKRRNRKMEKKTAWRIMPKMLLLAMVVTLIGGIVPITFAGGFTDDFSTDMWTDFSGDSTYDVYVDTSAGVLRFYSEASDRDFSYRQIEPAENVTVEFKIRITFTQNTGIVFIGLADAPDSVHRGYPYVTNTQPPSEVTRGIFLVVQGPHWTPRGNHIMFSGYQYGPPENWTQDIWGSAGYDFDLNTDYFAKIIKEGGSAIVELWDASKTIVLFRKDWGGIGLPTLRYLLVSDNYIGSDEGYGWTRWDQVHGYIDDLQVSWPTPTLTITMTNLNSGKTETITLELTDEDHDGFITLDIHNRILAAVRRTHGTKTFDFPGEYTATQGAWTVTLSSSSDYTVTLT
jgi:hypothetical protein